MEHPYRFWPMKDRYRLEDGREKRRRRSSEAGFCSYFGRFGRNSSVASAHARKSTETWQDAAEVENIWPAQQSLSQEGHLDTRDAFYPTGVHKHGLLMQVGMFPPVRVERPIDLSNNDQVLKYGMVSEEPMVHLHTVTEHTFQFDVSQMQRATIYRRRVESLRRACERNLVKYQGEHNIVPRQRQSGRVSSMDHIETDTKSMERQIEKADGFLSENIQSDPASSWFTAEDIAPVSLARPCVTISKEDAACDVITTGDGKLYPGRPRSRSASRERGNSTTSRSHHEIKKETGSTCCYTAEGKYDAKTMTCFKEAADCEDTSSTQDNDIRHSQLDEFLLELGTKRSSRSKVKDAQRPVSKTTVAETTQGETDENEVQIIDLNSSESPSSN